MCHTQGLGILGTLPCLQRPLDTLRRVIPLSEEHSSHSEPVVIPPRQHGGLQPFQPVLVVTEERHQLLPSTRPEEGLPLANDEIERHVVPLLDRELLRVPQCLLQRWGCFRIGILPRCLRCHQGQIRDRLRRLVRVGIVVCQAVMDLVQPVCVERFQCLPCRCMQRLLTGCQETGVCHLLGQGMLEDIHGVSCARAFKQQLQAFQF